MKLSDLDEARRLAQSRAKLVAELADLRAAETMLVDVTGPKATAVLKVSLLGGGFHEQGSPDEILFAAVLEVLVMGFEKRLAVIDARLVEIGVTP